MKFLTNTGERQNQLLKHILEPPPEPFHFEINEAIVSKSTYTHINDI